MPVLGFFVCLSSDTSLPGKKKKKTAIRTFRYFPPYLLDQKMICKFLNFVEASFESSDLDVTWLDRSSS